VERDLRSQCKQYEKFMDVPFYAAPSTVTPKSSHVFLPEKFLPEMEYLGRVTRFTPYKEKFSINPIFTQWEAISGVKFEHSYAMTQLNASALEKSILKYNRPQPKFEFRLWNVALDWTERHFRPYLSESKVSDHETVIYELDKSKSAGYPWNLTYKNKKEFLAESKNIDYLVQYYESLATVDPWKSFWVASLKSEMRDVEKLRENKIRTFTASAVEHVYATNRLCLDMNNKFYRTNNEHWSFVGASKFYGGWDKLYRRLSKHPNAFELDESSFDASLFRDAMYGQLYLRKKFCRYTEKEQRQLEEVYNQIVDSVLVMGNGQVFRKNTGNPSGSANTIVDNTMILFRLFAYAWLDIMSVKCKEKANYVSFMKEVEAALNGDDNTYTCSAKVVEWFNPKAIMESWAKLGVVTTTPCLGPRKLEDVNFLSMSFQWYPDKQMWLPRPDRGRVMCSLREGSNNLDVRWLMLRAFALRIESWPDKETRDDIIQLIQWVEREYGHMLRGTVVKSPLGEDFDITYDFIKTGYRTDGELERLYCSRANRLQGDFGEEEEDLKEFKACLWWCMAHEESLCYSSVSQSNRPVPVKKQSGVLSAKTEDIRREEMPKVRKATEAAAAYKKAKKAEKTAKRAMAGPKKKANKHGKVGKHMGRGGGTRSYAAPAARGFEHRNSRGVKTRVRVVNDTAISLQLTGIASTNPGSCDQVFMFSLNPGLAPDVGYMPGRPSYVNGLSLWSSQQARLYQKHSLKPKGCHVTVRYKAACGSTTAGTVGITFFRNAIGAVPTAGATARQQYIDQKTTHLAVYGSVWKDHTASFRPDKDDKNERQVRVGIPSIPQSDGSALTGVASDLNEYDYGFCCIWLDSVAASTVVGNVDIDYNWEVNTPSVVLAGLAEDESLAQSDHYELLSVGNPLVNLTVPLMSSTTRFNWTAPLAAYQSASGSSMFGGGLWQKAPGSSLATNIDPATGYLSFPDVGLYSVTVRLQVAFNAALAVGDFGFVNQWVSGGTQTNYFPVTRTTSAGVAVQQFWDSSLSPNCAGYGCDNPYSINYMTYTDIVLVTDVAGRYQLVGWSGNFGSFSTAPIANSMLTNTVSGDVVITELGPAQTVAVKKKIKENEKKEQSELKEKVAELSATLSSLVSANGLKPSPLVRDRREIEMVCPKEPRLPSRFEYEKWTEWENAKSFALKKFGDAKADATAPAKSIEPGKVSPTPSLAIALERVKEDYVVISKEEKNDDGTKRSRSLPRAVQ